MQKNESTPAPPETPPTPPPLSSSSKFNIRFMRRTNRVAIAVFIGAIIYKLITVWLRD